ncbi:MULTISPECIES: bifunctional phosphopantothenoylcysteine decarboxylase/phosphopantothenate--cysteine ligase CoaBC [Candidatus Nitrosocaldus]|jgi:phosphopantothenoylcysteine decarboxylase/phosphopantothenate--cysteine ligase|uniref:Coenzyme A biosynthesis bifunctional protein CoaBC n=1 Tax=Candidatus Nitrosocaldus cavascurensis TaxID=2058097 RepID=A0A2K5ANL3_9ARCH|nr:MULTISPECIES: bifunctional phosphopantothenoylcysteine decarboxylase/phosphopantothenate--cysteine ligase CoaBC [Candidatus Nitrosocaldus]SPC33224.1 Coenzyme A biosynthesis bifunctional protein CoaBC [Candidatus Nitrosocaldus cavascurensis]
MHPSKEIIGSHGDELKGKRIVLCVTASIAAYKAVDLARLLMRHGADVYPVLTRKATKLVGSELLSWATGNRAVVDLTWELEHIQLADKDRADLIIIYPCTANTLSKIANGIDDTSVTTVASVALGSRIPIIIALAMHEVMYHNPMVARNVRALQGIVEFVDPVIEEGKAKVAEPEHVLAKAIEVLKRRALLKGKSILITAGATVEHIDNVRVITNLSSGRFGTAFAREAMLMGADVTLIYGHGSIDPPSNVRIIKVSTSKDMLNALTNELKSKRYDAVIMNAAVADFRPAQVSSSKIESRDSNGLMLRLEPTEKIVDVVKMLSPDTFLIAFKADDCSREELIAKAKAKLQECRGDIVVANYASRSISKDGCDAVIVSSDGSIMDLHGRKDDVARRILAYMAERMASLSSQSPLSSSQQQHQQQQQNKNDNK